MKHKSPIRCADGVELVNRFARHHATLRADNGFGMPTNTAHTSEQNRGAFNNLQDTPVAAPTPVAPKVNNVAEPKKVGGAAMLGTGDFHMEGPQLHPLEMADGGFFDSVKQAIGLRPPAPPAQTRAQMNAERLRAEGGNWGNVARSEAPASAPRGGSGASFQTARAMKELGLRDGGELRMWQGGEGHRSILDGLGDIHNSLGEMATGVGDYFSPQSMLPTPRRLTGISQTPTPSLSSQVSNFMKPLGDLASSLVPQRGNSSTPERNWYGAGARPTPATTPAAAPVAAPVVASGADHMGITHTPNVAQGTDRAAFLARNPNIAANYADEAVAKATPSPSPLPTNLRDQGVQQPWRTVNTMRTDLEKNVIKQDLYKQGNSYSDRAGGGVQRAPQSAQDQQAVQNMFARTPNMKDGGQLRMPSGTGGVVPGSGSGDKIPAKYEPGEFVVSNDMLDAQPELRNHLRSLREQVLAEKGMTVAEADAKVMNGGKGLRAQLSLGDVYLGGGSPEDKLAAIAGVYAARTGAPDPKVMTQGPDGVTLPGQKSPGRAMTVQQPGVRVSPETAVALTADSGRGFTSGPTNLGRDPHTISQPLGGDKTAGRFPVGEATTPPGTSLRTQPMPAPGPGFRDPYYYIGNRVGKALTSPLVQAVGKYGNIADFAYEGHKTINDAQQGNTAGAIDHGALAASDVAASGLLGKAAGNLGLAYSAGHLVGKHVVNPMLSQETKDSIGSGVNTLVRGAGRMVGQDWGVDDTALRTVNGTLPKAKTQAQAQQPQDFTDANNAKLAAFKTEWDKYNGPAEVGATRITDHGGNMLADGQEMVYTGPKMGWQQRTSDAQKQKLNADTLKWQQDNANDAALRKAETQATLDRFALRDQQEAMNQPMSKHRRAQMTALMDQQQRMQAAKLQAESSANQVAATREGNQLSYQSSVLNNRATNKLAVFQAQRDQANKDREFTQRQEKQDSDLRGDADKALTSELEAFHTTRDKDGTTIVNKDAVAASKSVITSHLTSLIQAAEKRGDMKTAEELRTKGASAMGKDGLQRLLSQIEMRNRSAAAHGAWNPFAGTHIDSNNPTDYDITGVEPGVMQDQYMLRGGGRIPTRMVDYAKGGGALMPNDMVDTRSTRLDNLKQLRTQQ